MNSSKISISETDSDSISNNSQISSQTNGNAEDDEEKQKLIERILELQSTLEDLSNKVNEVKEENYKLKSENQILNGYMDNLMSASSSFHTAWKKQEK